MASLSQLKKQIRLEATPARAKVNAWFFKTGKGEYGYGDTFIGLTVPASRKIAQKFIDLPLKDVEKLLSSPIHEERLIALLMLVEKFKKGDEQTQKEIYTFYLASTKWINNWDLVDLSADKIVGAYLCTRSRKILYKLVKSKNLWEKRISIIATFYFIRQHDFTDTLALAELLLHDAHDLIHKAVGWMLREVGKRSLKDELVFLDAHVARMPRTALRYAIERFPEPLKRKYMSVKKIKTI